MKLLLFLAVSAQSQSDVESEIDGPVERYFFTEATTTTPAPAPTPAPDGPATDLNVCWKCDSMSYSDCATSGKYTLCGLGEHSSCFYEIREVEGALAQLCTGCKQTEACTDLRNENFRDVNNVDMLNDQCKPSYLNQRGNTRNGNQQSVCRTCSQTCRSDLFGGAFCFGSISSNVGQQFMIPFATHVAQYPGLYNPVDTLALGIPTYAFLDGTLDDTAIDTIEDFSVMNIYLNNNVNGKVRPNVGDNIRTLDEMTYWALQGQDRAWWNTDLSVVQDTYNARMVAGGCTASAATDGTYALTSCGSGFTSLTP